MLIIGCDFHARYQQIAMAREATGESLVERRLDHESGEAHALYRNLQDWHEPVRVGIEATGPRRGKQGQDQNCFKVQKGDPPATLTRKDKFKIVSASLECYTGPGMSRG